MADGILSAQEKMVAVDSETGYDSDPWSSSDPTEWLAFENFDVSANIAEHQDQRILATHDTLPSEFVGQSLGVSWTLPLTGKSAAAGTAPDWAALLKSANFEEILDASSALYKPITSDLITRVPSAHFAYYMVEKGHDQARKMLIGGTRGNRTFTFNQGEWAKMTGEDTALFTPFPSTPQAKPSNPTEYTGGKSLLRVQGMTLSVGGTNYAVAGCEVQTNWSVGEDSDLTADEMVDYISLYRERTSPIGGSLTLRGKSAALNNIISQLTSSSPTFELVITVSDGTDSIEFKMPVCQFTGYTPSASNGSTNFDLPFIAHGDLTDGGGENALQIKCT